MTVTTMSAIRYLGRIASIPGANDFAFIGIGSVTQEGGSPHDLNTAQDIFLHKDDCAAELKVGMEISFDAIPDRKRGNDTFRAVGAIEHIEVELLPRNRRPKTALALREHLPVHAGMKFVPEEMVSRVIANNPMPCIPRVNNIPQDEATKLGLVQWLLSTFFPNMASFGSEHNIFNQTDVELDHEVGELAENYRLLGLEQEIEVIRSEEKRFKEVRGALTLMFEENLIRHDTIIPIHYLPDLFMAVPVWYFWVNQEDQAVAQERITEVQKRIMDDSGLALDDSHPIIQHFCQLFPSRNWQVTFRLFNSDLRTFQQYDGELIPSSVASRMRKAVEFFDFLVIATPYLDRAGKGWEDIKWPRSVDPYVLGFKKGIPFFFVLARFSGTGTFPIFNELVADTTEFLRENKQKLDGFKRGRSPRWYQRWCQEKERQLFKPSHSTEEMMEHQRQMHLLVPGISDFLKQHADRLLNSFEAGSLFNWLRGEEIATK